MSKPFPFVDMLFNNVQNDFWAQTMSHNFLLEMRKRITIYTWSIVAILIIYPYVFYHTMNFIIRNTQSNGILMVGGAILFTFGIFSWFYFILRCISSIYTKWLFDPMTNDEILKLSQEISGTNNESRIKNLCSKQGFLLRPQIEAIKKYCYREKNMDAVLNEFGIKK